MSAFYASASARGRDMIGKFKPIVPVFMLASVVAAGPSTAVAGESVDLPLVVQASAEQDRGGSKASTLTVCFESYRPLRYWTPDGPRGPQVEIMLKVAASRNIAVEFQHLPYRRCVHSVRTGRIDAVLGGVEIDLVSVVPEIGYRMVAAFAVGPLADNEERTDFDGLRFASVDDLQWPPSLAATRPSFIEHVPTSEQNIRMLLSGRVDVLIDDFFRVSDLVSRDVNAPRIIPLKPLLESKPEWIQISPDFARHDQDMWAELARLHSTGEFDIAYIKAMGFSYAQLSFLSQLGAEGGSDIDVLWQGTLKAGGQVSSR